MSSDPAADEPEPPASQQEWRLRALHTSEEEVAAIAITDAGVSIGRSESNDIVLPSEDFPSVSGTHVRAVLRDSVVWIEDLGSKNGTLLRGASIKRVALEHGDVFELGKGGPRFVVLSPSAAAQTVVVTQRIARSKREMGAETVELVREQLGIPANTMVTDVVKGETRRNTYLLVLVLVVLVVGGFFGVRELQRTGGDVMELRKKIDEQLHAATDRLDSHRAAWERRVAEMESAYETSKAETRLALEKERDELSAKITSLGSAEDLKDIQKQLEETKKRLESFNPVTREQTRLATVKDIFRAVVFVEIAQTFVHSSKRTLYVDVSDSGRTIPNLDKQGELYVQESTGSGFVFSKEGWILTNAHVVLKKNAQETLRLKDLVLKSAVDIKVVFSGTEQRIKATLKDWVARGSQDLALLKIEKFPGMPFVPAGIDTKRPRPASITPVYVLGFPLGKRALQPGNSVIASAFRGIVSRGVTEFLQVDAAVHPGNSGGPVINDAGQIIGVVVGMQRISADQAATDMGYIIPIDLAGTIWPYKPGRKKN